MVEEIARRVDRLVLKAGRVLRGHPPDIQGATLAMLTATFLAGHHDLAGQEETGQMRERILAEHVKTVRALIPVVHALNVKPKMN